MIRNRIVSFRHVRAADLRPHPKNWRLHPDSQRQALAGILAEIGYVDALLARPLADGSLQLVDGHLRAELTPEEQVPVLVADLSEQEAEKVLATLDPLSSLAQADPERLGALLGDVASDEQAVQTLLDGLAASVAAPATDERDRDLQPIWQVVVECDDEAMQQQVFEELRRAGRKCRLVNLY